MLRISVPCALADEPIEGEFTVDAIGKVFLGQSYGSVTVKGLTLEEAEKTCR